MACKANPFKPNLYAEGMRILSEAIVMEPKLDKPANREEMIQYMKWIGVQEGFDLHADIVENGWCENEIEAKLWLESMDILPKED